MDNLKPKIIDLKNYQQKLKEEQRKSRQHQQQLTRRLYLRISGFISIIICLIYLSSTLPPQHKNLASTTLADGTIKVTAKPNLQGEFIFKGLLNTHLVTYKIDNNSMYLAIPQHLAKNLKLTKNNNSAQEIQTAHINIHSINIGDLEVTHVKSFLVDEDDSDYIRIGNTLLERMNMRMEKGYLVLSSQ